jgi:hypothetical protein
VIESAAKTLEEDKSLAVLFLSAAKSSALDEKMKKTIMSALIRKVLHAQVAAEHDKFKLQKTNRESTMTSFRGALKVLSKRNENWKKTKKQRTSASIDDIGENSQMCLDE